MGRGQDSEAQSKLRFCQGRLCPLAFAMLLVVVAAALLVANHQQSTRFTAAVTRFADSQEALAAADASFWRNGQTTPSPEDLARTAEKIAESRLHMLAVTPLLPRSQADALVASLEEYARHSRGFFAAASQGKDESAEEIAASHLAPLRAHHHQLMRGALAHLTQTNSTHEATTLTGTLLALLMAVGLSVGFAIGFRRDHDQAALDQAQRRAEAESWQRFRTLWRDAKDIIILVDPVGQIQLVSHSLEAALGHPVQAGDSASQLMPPDDRTEFYAALEALHRGAPSACSTFRLSGSGETEFWFEATFANLLHEPGVEGYLITCRDVTDQRQFQDALRRQAHFDTLTGLPNRQKLVSELETTLSNHKSGMPTPAVMLVDIDHFKVINDSLGHSAGDGLLVTFAERLQTCLRPSDLVARLGGDEFLVLLREVRSEEDALMVSDRVLRSLAHPVPVAGRTIVPSASIGLVIAEPDSTAEAMLRDADTALYRAKAEGRQKAVTYRPEMSQEALERLELESELRRALKEQHFVIYYQPIVDLQTLEIIQLEALIRWMHPERGMISPMKFIPIAEETGLIVAIGEWVLREGCRQVRRLQQRFGTEVELNVNLSTMQLLAPDLVSQVRAAVEDTAFEPKQLKLEITESVMMQNLDTNLARLNEIRDMGIQIAVDDFGTGYSSMAYLSRLPLTTLKVDRSFVKRLGESPEDDAIVRSIIGLANSLRLKVTSEGIETQDQLERLRELGADYGQGFLFYRPMPMEEIESLYKTDSARSAA